MLPPTRPPYPLLHLSRLRVPDSTPSNEVELACRSGMSQPLHVRRGTGSSDWPGPCAPIVAPGGCCCLSKVYTVAIRWARRSSLACPRPWSPVALAICDSLTFEESSPRSLSLPAAATFTRVLATSLRSAPWCAGIHRTVIVLLRPTTRPCGWMAMAKR